MTQAINSNQKNRNLMILYAVVGVLSIAGVALNVIQVFNLKSLVKDSKMPLDSVSVLSKGFYLIALFYLLIALTSVGAILKKKYSKQVLIMLVVLFLIVFVFGPYILNIIFGDSALDINLN